MAVPYTLTSKLFANPEHTVCFVDLGKLNLPMVVRFKLKPVFDTAPATSKNEARVKSG